MFPISSKSGVRSFTAISRGDARTRLAAGVALFRGLGRGILTEQSLGQHDAGARTASPVLIFKTLKEEDHE